MPNLQDDYRHLCRWNGQPSVSRVKPWTRKDKKSVERRFERSFARCLFDENPLIVKANINSSRLGHLLAAFFADAIDKHLVGFRIRSSHGQGYPDKGLERLADGNLDALEIKAPGAYEPKSTQRMSLTCSADKLQRNFEGPVRHLVATIYYEKRGRKVWLRSYYLFFFQPWTQIKIRLECSTNQHLLEQAKHPRFRG
jgi:hypothetical protein